jgi:hypothetical protein
MLLQSKTCLPRVDVSAEVPVVWFFHLGTEQRSCETRLAADGNGYELVTVEGGRQHREQFQQLVQLLSREHELLSAWKAQGWRQRGFVRVRG